MTKEQKETVRSLRLSGKGARKISQITGISENTIKSFIKSQNIVPDESLIKRHLCLNCGKPVEQHLKRKEKKFCSDKCRMTWWNAHQEQINKKAVYEFTCKKCKKVFTAYGNSKRKYCCHECYILDRFGEVDA